MIRMSTIVKTYYKCSGDLGITFFVKQNSLGTSPFFRGAAVGRTWREYVMKYELLCARKLTTPWRRRDSINNVLDGGGYTQITKP